MRLATREQFDWEALFRVPRVVILAEAGAGKTCEARHAVRSLLERGKFALFVELQALAASGLEPAAENFCMQKFEELRESGEPGWFVLDSLDEAKLRSHTLGEGLRQLRRSITGTELHAHVILTCRPSDWRAEADLRDFEQVFPFTFAWPGHPQGLEVPAHAGIESYAGVTNTADFLSALDACNAAAFAARPLDLLRLARFWRKEQRIESLKELIENSIAEDLNEWNPDREHRLTTSPQVLRHMAELLPCGSARHAQRKLASTSGALGAR